MGDQSMRNEMKLVVGLGSVEDYPDYVEAGADEVFIGYVPMDYRLRYGKHAPLNRREVLYYNVQIGSFSELLILKDMWQAYGVPVTIALNGLTYSEKTREEIVEMVLRLQEIGYDRFIVAEEALLQRLSQINGITLILSGEYGELNRDVLANLPKFHRVIYPRQTSIEEMASMVRNSKSTGITEHEAFVLNEKCHFTGAYCMSKHCDELCHMCRVPYRMEEERERFAVTEEDSTENFASDDGELLGASGCGLCALYRLRKAGITHLKLVSRGNATEETIRDIREVRKALQILDLAKDEADYRRRMQEMLFPAGCSGNCYYPEIKKEKGTINE